MAKKQLTQEEEELRRLEAQSLDATRQMLGIQNQILEVMEERNLAEEIYLGMQQTGKTSCRFSC